MPDQDNAQDPNQGTEPAKTDPNRKTDDPGKKGDKKSPFLEDPEVVAEIDRRVTQAVLKREEKHAEELKRLREEEEHKRLETEGNYKELAKRLEQKIEEFSTAQKQAELRSQTLDLLSQEGLSEVRDLLDIDTSTLEGRKEFAAKFKEITGTVVDREVKGRIGSGGTPPNKKKSTDAPPNVKLADMSPEQKSKYVEDHGLEAFDKLVKAQKREIQFD